MSSLRTRIFLLCASVLALTLATLGGTPTSAMAGPNPPCVQVGPGEVTRVAFVPQTKFVVTACANGVATLWSFPELKRMRDVLTGEAGLISLTVSRNGKRVAAADAAGNLWMAWLWGDEAKQPPARQRLQSDAVLDLMASGDDKSFYGLMLNPSQANPSIRTWESENLTPSTWFEGAAVPSLWSFSADTATTLIAAASETGHIVRWKTPQSTPARYARQQAQFTCTATAPDGKTCFFGDSKGGIWVITEARKEPVKTWQLAMPIASLSVDGEGQFIAIGVGRPTRKDIYRRTSLKQPYVTLTGAPLPVYLMTTATCVSGSGTGAPTDKQVYTFDGPVGGALCTTFSENGRHLVIGGADGTLRVWLITDGRSRLLSLR